MPRILVLFASTHGHTAKIAARIAAMLEDDAATVDLQHLEAHESQPAPADYDAVIAGASIHASHHQRALVKWAGHHHTSQDSDHTGRAAVERWAHELPTTLTPVAASA